MTTTSAASSRSPARPTRQAWRRASVRVGAISESGDRVIVRVLRLRVRPGRVGAFNALFRRQLALLRDQPGLLYVKLARRQRSDGGQEAVLFEEWQDAASLYAWVGPNLQEPRLIPGLRELTVDIHVAHYEALADEDVEASDRADPEQAAG